jgi:hypothetical protein
MLSQAKNSSEDIAPHPPPDYKMPARIFRMEEPLNFDVHWNAGSIFKSHAFNTISYALPAGEKWIIDTIRSTLKEKPWINKSDWNELINEFLTQESIHRGVHLRYNTHLIQKGYPNWIEERSQRRVSWGRQRNLLTQLASAVAYEHLTATFASAMMVNPHWLNNADPKLSRMWFWHAAEELEHKHFVLDFYRVAGGGEVRRVLWYLWTLVTFLLDVHLQLFKMIRKSGGLWDWKTWRDAAIFNFAPGGLMWATFLGTIRFLSPRFQPKFEAGDRIANDWLSSAGDDVQMRSAVASRDVACKLTPTDAQ